MQDSRLNIATDKRLRYTVLGKETKSVLCKRLIPQIMVNVAIIDPERTVFSFVSLELVSWSPPCFSPEQSTGLLLGFAVKLAFQAQSDPWPTLDHVSATRSRNTQRRIPPSFIDSMHSLRRCETYLVDLYMCQGGLCGRRKFHQVRNTCRYVLLNFDFCTLPVET